VWRAPWVDVHLAEPAPTANQRPEPEVAERSQASAAGTSPALGPKSLSEVERQHIVRTLELTSWVVEGASGAATVLGIHPNTLRSRMKKLGIARDAKR
jgi:transcriptional regulator with GAF, ATPase, and Fis domain